MIREKITEQLFDWTLDREVGELGRIDELYQLMCRDDCQNAALSAHFGQALNMQCGHCSACAGHALGQLPEPDYPRVGDSATTAVRKLSQEKPEALRDARQQARFLCGLSSPKLIRSRLSQHPLYGCCSRIPLDRVLNALLA